MKLLRSLVPALFALPLLAQPGSGLLLKPGRDAGQAVDEEYTKKIHEYTTETFFNSPLTDYLPASKTVPTPKAVLGDIAGAPGILPYSAEVYRYMRMLEKATPRVKVFSIGKTEEGREMIAVAVANERLIATLDENRARLAKLADPRTIKMDDAEAEKLVAASTPIYYITGTIHSTETGAPTALMELAYRLAVDESAYIKSIRDHVITLITPVVEVDGRDRMVDIYRWHRENPNKQWPPLVYWGHYVAHDNNRDSMGLTLQLTRNVLNTFVGFKAQVLHDLHESVPYLYDNTVGDGPYNAWIDPILADEWQMMGWNNVSEMTKLGMPGVFTHGTFDTWSPSYLMFIAAMHNGISRLYETFGNGGADTEERSLRPNEYARTWFKQNPPLPKTKWSQRNNNNYEQTGVLTALHYFAGNDKLFLRNFYLKARRSIEKPRTEGPSAYVFPSDDPRPGAQADLLRMLQDQGCEISRATAPVTVMMPAKKAPARGGRGGRGGAGDTADASADAAPAKPAEKPKPEPRTFPAGSYVLRMDQPYSRIADTLLDYQYWAANDPQKSIYDDTGWTFGELGNVQVSRVTDVKILDAAMERLPGPVQAAGGVESTGEIFLINHNADNALITLRYRFPAATFDTCRGAVRSRRPQVQPRKLHCAPGGCGRPRQGRRRTRREGIRRGHRARCEGPSGPRRAHRHHAHLAEHTERRLVAAGVRPPEDSLRVHQHADRRGHRRPARQIRRDRVCSRSARQSASDHQRHADVRQSAAVEGHAAHAKSRQDRRNRRHASRTRMGGPRSFTGVCAQGRIVDHRQRHYEFRRGVRIHARRQHRRHDATQSDGFGAPLQDGGCRQPDCLRLPRQSGDLCVEPSGFQRHQYGRRWRRPSRRRRRTRTAYRTGHGGRSRSSAGTQSG